MSVSLKQLITVVPLRKPQEKLWMKGKCEREMASKITEVFQKFEKVDDRKDLSLSRPGRGKEETSSRATISLKGFARESPGMWYISLDKGTKSKQD